MAAALRQWLPPLWVAAMLLVAGCATMPPGLDVPKTESSALAEPESTTLGKRFGARAKQHPGLSGFLLLADGAESFAVRMQIAQKAERTLDVQYFVLQQDETGQLLLAALLGAADRGVRVRILLDDALGIDGGAKIRPLSAHPNVEIRVFNPFVTRQELTFQLRERGVRVRILTNSLASTDMPIVHAGYRNYRAPLLEMGVELYEVRRKLGEPETHAVRSNRRARGRSRFTPRCSCSIASGHSSAP